MIEKIEATSLWSIAFSKSNSAKHSVSCNRLSTEFWKFREKVAKLVSSISAVLPGLTVHDISHLDALWEVADMIAGEAYPLNPLEAFVFGGAVLLHDSAMCWEAYANGQAGVRKTTEWKDAYAVELDRSPEGDDRLCKDAADFSALRALHAHQASSLVTREWQHPDTKQSIFLIDDFELRNHVGQLIGKIASSHHWNIDVLSSKLGDQFNAPAWLPSEWRVDPIKIACLLRCADAAHINQSRAPDFLYAITRRSGVSKAHWQAQNRMMGPTLDAGDASDETVMYTSSIAYDVESVGAWWIAYDAVSVVDSEIRSSNTLLHNRKRAESAPEFKVKRVKGANSTGDMAELLQVENWTPCSAQIHVSNIESLVKNLGGEKLYGEGVNKTEVVLRELIQNARDSIVARKHVDPGCSGNIAIRFEIINNEPWLSIEDDGIGMSYQVLTGSLLDFGTSFWKSALIQEEFPGLRSSNFRSIGRFGIGFYSVFMIANSVTVASRRWDKGLEEANTLLFKNGLTFRPIIQSGRPENFNIRTSTRVLIKLKNGIIPESELMHIPSGRMGIPDLNPRLHDYIACIVAGLDVDVSFESPNFSKRIIHVAHTDTDSTTNSENILRQLSLLPYQHDINACDLYIKNNFDRLRWIKVNGYAVGLAAISTNAQSDQFRLGLKTIGGLAASVQGGVASEYIGYLNHKPNSAKRDAADIDAPQESITEWYREQLEILRTSSFGDYERCVVASNACALRQDPLLIGSLLIIVGDQPRFACYKEVASMAESIPIVIFKSKFMNHIEMHHKISKHHDKILIRPLTNGNYLSLEFENNVPKNPNSMIGCLHRAVLSNGRIPAWSTITSQYDSAFGAMDELTLSINSNN